MKLYLSKIFNKNWFFAALLCFVIVLPFSQALVSIFGGVLFFAALADGNWSSKVEYIKQRKTLFSIPLIFLIYLVSSIVTFNKGESLYDLNKSLFFLVIPLAFILGKEISDTQKRFIFYAFALSIFVSTLIALINWFFLKEQNSFEVHKISLISHIRFSFQIILIFWFFILLSEKNKEIYSRKKRGILIIISLYFLAFLLFQQSLTGLLAFGVSVFFYFAYFLFKYPFKYEKIYLIGSCILIVSPVIYIAIIVVSFYNIEKVDKELVEKRTTRGNLYEHYFDDPLVENGKYVYLYVCEEEMREEWNKLSEYKYDSIGINGYLVNSTLVRYLTSKGLRKDADGVNALSQEDINNVENGIANVIFSEKKYSLYPRIYQTVWEYYVYSKTGDANYQSFSQRIEYSLAAISIVKKNPWFGVGTGNWKEEFRNTYINSGSKLNPDLYASSHNQYLNYMVKFGISGFLLIMFLLVFPVIKTKRYRDSLFMIFLVYIAIANFADSNLESHMGSSFFIFFYCLFLVSGSADFLKIEKENQSVKRN